MGLTSALRIGQTALTASQLGVQVTGNNMANVATPGYSRRSLLLTPLESSDPLQRLQAGNGVGPQSLTRVIDEAVIARLRGQIAREREANQSLESLAALEAAIGELSETGLTTQLNEFFGAWSDRSTLVASDGVVVQQAQTLVSNIKRLRTDLVEQKTQTDRLLDTLVPRVDDLLSEVAALNKDVSRAQVAGGDTATLRDQRDRVLDELAGLIDVDTVERGSGAVDVYVGSTPMVLAGQSRGIELRREAVDGRTELTLRVKSDGSILPVRSGQVGALLKARDNAVGDTIEKLDELAAELIYQTNRVHATATGPEGLREATSQLRMPPEDRTSPLNGPGNPTTADLPFEIRNGSFLVHVKSPVSGASEATRIQVDLDGLGADGAAGSIDDASLEAIRQALDDVEGLRADFTLDGRLRVRGENGASFSFSEDSSGLLGAIGMNAFFSGTSAEDIAVRADIASEPTKLQVGRIGADGEFRENAAALDMAQLQDRGFEALGGQSINGFWSTVAGDVGAQTHTAQTTAQAAAVVRESIEAQRAAVSGVSLDEEAINLVTYQQAYQGAARFISVVDQLNQELLGIFS
jgi:flagellar hook-associated protein 1 FlgK